MMYCKNLKEDLRLRLTKEDMDYLREESEKRGTSISEVIRSMIGEYRRTSEVLAIVSDALGKCGKDKGGAVHGDTKTDINHIL